MAEILRTFEVNQILHGYDSGHRLLASSFDVPKETRRLLLSMSDMSGPRMIKGFESYLTGYPLDELNSYAFARTWYAPELPRPGCVWTHTLVISVNDLVQTRSLIDLDLLFSRPSVLDKFSEYRKPIEYVDLPTSMTQKGIPDQREHNLLTTFFLCPPALPVYVPANEASEFEKTLILIWDTQWPDLKKRFTFSTGSIASRSINGKTLDIQQIPVGTIALVRRESPNSVFVSENLGFPAYPEMYKNIPFTDLSKTNIYEFLKFLSTHTEDINGGRELYKPLLEIYLDSVSGNTDEVSLRRRTEIIARTFQEASNASGLKTAIYGARFATDSKPQGIDEEASLLFELVTTPFHSSFDRNSLNIMARSAKLWKKSKLAALALLDKITRAQYNLFVDDFIDGIAISANPDDVELLMRLKPGLISYLVSKNSSLAYSEAFWTQPPSACREIFDTLCNSESSLEIDWTRVIYAILSTGSDDLAQQVVRRLGSTGAEIVLNWFQERGNRLSEPWANALARQSDAVMSWLTQNPRVRRPLLLVLLRTLAGQPNDFYRQDVRAWLRIADIQLSSHGDNLSPEIETFLLSIGLDNRAAGAERLVIGFFDVIHDALADEALSYESWRVLEPQLPSLGIARNWDKCERLRRAFVRDIIQYRWPLESFFQVTKRDETFVRLCRSCRKSDQGKFLLHNLKVSVASSEVIATERQRETIMST